MQVPQYTFPKIGVTTNDAQLNSHRLRLLKQNYQNRQNQAYLNSKHNYQNNSSWFKSGIPSKISNQYNNHNNPIEPTKFSIGRSLSQPKFLNKRINEQIIKNSWSNQLTQQIALKQQIKKMQKNDKIQLEKQLVKDNSNIYRNQVINQKDFLQSFKKQALQNIKMKQEKKRTQKMNQRIQKSLIDRQYKDAQNNIKNTIFGVGDVENDKRRSQSSIDTYSPKQLISNPQNIGEVKKPYAYRVFNQQLKKHKDHLKQALLEQIKMREQSDKMQKLKKINTPFIQQKYKIADNPIINPIDIKIAKDNPYIIKQLLNKKMMTTNQPVSRMGLPGSNHSQASNKNSQISALKQSSTGQRLGMIGNSQQASRYSSEASKKDEQLSSYLSRRGSTSLLTNSNIFY